jgi:hypothetical protein
MALVLGTNAYIDSATFTAWALERGYDLAPYSSTVIENAITISSVDFIDVNYTFSGTPIAVQPMQLPTDLVTIANIINGAAQAAWLKLNGRLFVDPTTLTQNGEVVSESKDLGPLKKGIEYAEGRSRTYLYDVQSVDRLLAAFTIGGSGLVRW